MGRTYLRIFLTFWLVTLTMVIGSMITVHWYELAPDKHLPSDMAHSDKTPGSRLLREVAGEIINYSYDSVTYGVKRMPEWANRHIYLINRDGNDSLGRPLPTHIQEIAQQLTPQHTYVQMQLHDNEIDSEYPYLGRYLILIDNHPVKLIIEPHASNLYLQLFLASFWKVLLVSMIISGTACFFLSKHVTRDFRHIQDATQKIAKGNMEISLSNYFGCRSDEMAKIGINIDHMARSLKKAMSEQKRLIKDVSHELRSPLARLQLALAIAQQRSNGDIDLELNRIKEAAEYLNDIISDILSVPLSDNEPWELTDAIELNSLLTAITENCQLEANAKRVQLHLQHCAEDALVMTRGNSLIGVFENITRNAIHYTRADTRIDIILHLQQNGNYTVTISDQGPGVAEESLDDIFEPFFRTDSARARSSGGYGLGLAIAQRTVTLHSGTINAKNRPLNGLCITVTLPAATA